MSSIALLVASAALFAHQDPPAPEPLKLLPHGELLDALSAIARENPSFAKVLPVGASRGGREIQALRVSWNDPKPGTPAILVVANIDGPQVYTSALALYEAAELARRATIQDAAVQSVLATTTFYFVPRANPDAAEARFETPRFERTASGAGIDDDRDGRAGEDPPSDVDGDGAINWIRDEDPEGEWIADPLDARALVKADKAKGETPKWKLWREGRDLDRDEKVAEDAGVDALVNRNFAHDWKQFEGASGTFPMDEPESRALAEFVLLHPEIAMVVTYGELDNLVDKPKSVAVDAPRQLLVPAAGVLQPDADLLAEIGVRYAELTSNKTKGAGVESGSFQAWAYFQRGLWSLAIHPWDVPLDVAEKKAEGEKKDGETADDKKDDEADDAKPDDAPKTDKKDEKKDEKKKREPSDDAKRLKWIDQENEGARFVAWREFEHPELGKVEIGGFAPFARTEPPAAKSREIATKQLEFLMTLGADLARVEVAECSAKLLSGDFGKSDEIWEVKAAIGVRERLPFQSASARRTNTSRPARVTLELPKDGELLAGERMQLIEDLQGSGGRSEMRWLVSTGDPSNIFVTVDTANAGKVSSRPQRVN